MPVSITQLVTLIAIPLLSPLVAAAALVFGLRKEIRLLRVQRLQDRRQRANAIATEICFATAIFHILAEEQAQGAGISERMIQLRSSFERILEKLRTEPEIGDDLRDRVRFLSKGGISERMFMLLVYADQKTAETNPSKADLVIVKLALLTMSYLYETKEQRVISGSYEAINLIHQSNPGLFERLIIDPNTPSLRQTI